MWTVLESVCPTASRPAPCLLHHTPSYTRPLCCLQQYANQAPLMPIHKWPGYTGPIHFSKPTGASMSPWNRTPNFYSSPAYTLQVVTQIWSVLTSNFVKLLFGKGCLETFGHTSHCRTQAQLLLDRIVFPSWWVSTGLSAISSLKTLPTQSPTILEWSLQSCHSSLLSGSRQWLWEHTSRSLSLMPNKTCSDMCVTHSSTTWPQNSTPRITPQWSNAMNNRYWHSEVWTGTHHWGLDRLSLPFCTNYLGTPSLFNCPWGIQI